MGSKHLIDLEDFEVSRWESIINLAHNIAKAPQFYFGACHGKILATLFYEPSTRTQLSFQTAMLRLGGRIIGFDNPQNSSVAKGENLKDTVTIMGSYADIMVLRHPYEGAAKAASLYAGCPVINAGDGGHLHPTQTLTDLVTLSMDKGRLDHLKVGLCGDLKNGRTVHSLIKALSHFEGNSFCLVSTPELRVPQYMRDIMDARGVKYTEVSSLDDVMGDLDVLYMTRIQRERFASQEEYEQQNSKYILDVKKMKLARPDMIVLHPLPRVDEIEIAVDDDPRARYFAQAKYGVYTRMALIMNMLSDPDPKPLNELADPAAHCTNARCITQVEPYLPHLAQQNNRCGFCDHDLVKNQ